MNDEAKKANQNLPGMGGVFNVVNFHLYHYAGNNPVKYTDPDGREQKPPAYATLSNVVNMDFGLDYSRLADTNFKNGHYALGALNIVASASEATYDVIAVYGGAKIVAAVSAAIISFFSGGGFGDLSRAKDFEIKAYDALKYTIKGSGLQAHHIIEKRFLPALQNLKFKAGDMLSVALSPAEHQKITNAWRKAFSYGTDYTKLTVQQIWQKAQEIYANYPELLKAAKQTLGVE